jgi:5-methylcytosine-specific restriction endonuclease McrA
MTAARFCSQPDCRGIVRNNECSLCGPKVRHGFRHVGSAASRGYDATWQRTREAFIRSQSIEAAERGELLACALCRKTLSGEIHVDHINGFSGMDDPARLDTSNLQCVHRRCHMQKSAKEARKTGTRGVILCGPPCGGKTYYAREHAAPGDLIWDADEVLGAMGIAHWQRQRDQWWWSLIRAMRQAVIATVHDCPVNWWMIISNPQVAQAVASETGASMVVCDPGIDVSLKRAAERDKLTQQRVEQWYHAASGIRR